MTSSADFRVVGVKIVVDPSPDAFAALRRAYSIVHAVPESPRTEVYSEAWLGAELPRMSIADGWDFLLRLERDGSLVPSPMRSGRDRLVGKSRPCRTQTLQGVTG